MTKKPMNKKIEELVEYINTNFKNGCKGWACEKCPLHYPKPGTIENTLCDLILQKSNDHKIIMKGEQHDYRDFK